MQLAVHAEYIHDLSIAATKELAIEEALTKIKDAWGVQKLDMSSEKGVSISKIQFNLSFIYHTFHDQYNKLASYEMRLSYCSYKDGIDGLWIK